VVVLVTIDAVRADIVADPTNDARFPTLAKLKRDGVVFTKASAPGTQTGVSLSTLFSGRYYSEQRWKNYGTGKDLHPYPADDPAPRFPELLSEHHVATTNEASLVFLRSDFGVARGFGEERLMGHSTQAAPGAGLIHALLDRLGHPGKGPLFLWTHLVEAHAPYGNRSQGKTDYDRYLSSVASDDALLGRVLRILESKFGERWALFVSADHGEAFGEHQTHEHAKTLYEELLHVPLLARSPLFPPREIGQRVGLIDLGPTLLDLFRVDTPATFNGQSLVPLLVGGNAALTRPILAEGRLRQALTRPDGLKVIEDRRRKVVEVYDLTSDPRESRNLFDVDTARSDAALAELRAFFAVHAWREPGYEPPYKR
jgi:arylsulfatase A-like enzyme